MPTCKSCGDTVSALYFDKAAGVCITCKNSNPTALDEERSLARAAADQPHRKVIATTALTIPQRDIAEIVDIVSAEAAIGVNVFRDISASIRDAFGGRSGSLQKVLREARRTCVDEIRKQAHAIGAEAVIAVDLDYSEYSSNLVGGGMLLVVATGTAVKLVPATSS